MPYTDTDANCSSRLKRLYNARESQDRMQAFPRLEKGDRHHLPERPGGCFAQMVPVPFFPGSDEVTLHFAPRQGFQAIDNRIQRQAVGQHRNSVGGGDQRGDAPAGVLAVAALLRGQDLLERDRFALQL